MKNYRERGFTLLEVMFATFFIVLVLGGVLVLVTRNISTLAFLEHEAVALGLAQEGMETVYAIRGSNFLDMLRGGGSVFTSNGLSGAVCASGCEISCVQPGDAFPYCSSLASGLSATRLIPFSDSFLHFNEADGTYGVGNDGVPSIYKREIRIIEQADFIEVHTEVRWNEKGSVRNVELETKLYDWIPG
jgi:Tfp pilus assembly protein PilV